MRRYSPVLATDHAEPIGSINTTPLIDVMLVLLIMFVITIPPMLNEVPMELPQQARVPGQPVTPHRLSITRDGEVSLDGRRVAGDALVAGLAAIRADPQSALIVANDPEARYDAFVRTLAIVKRAGITRLGFENNRRFAEL